MALVQFIRDTATDRNRGIPYPGFFVSNAVVSSSPATTFAIGVTVDSLHVIEVSVDGRMQFEGTAWNRNVGTGQVIFTGAVNVSSWVQIKVYLK